MRTELPEERLLRLIKSKGKKTADNLSHETKEASSEVFPAGRISKNCSLKPAHVLYASRLLTLVFLISIIYSLKIFFIPFEKRHASLTLNAQRTVLADQAKKAQRGSAGPELKDYSAYSQKIGSRRLFFSEKPTDSIEAAQVSELGSKFALVGIITGDNPQAVVEDGDGGRTYYLHKGASFNGAVVEEIGSGKVILNFRGERMSLAL